MASYGQATHMARPGVHAAAAPPPAGGVPPSYAPEGTFAPGTKIQVGSHRVVIQKYLSEGGFAHVYLVKLPAPVDGTDLAVLKRVAVPDKDSLRGMRTEVETMKRLKGHRAIVTYIDSHASEMRGGGYEVFLLMEFCDGGGLMDFMNTRLQHRLTEPEILGIFSDVAEGVACMHYLKPPLLHRDLKVENVLISKGTGKPGQRRRFKVCDFGSAALPKPAPVSVVECRLMDEDVQRHTTMQYRSPEMVDVYRRQPIDEKSDIWALGVLLYKLCYYTTPFEDQSSQLAILNASYRFPSHPVFSDRLKALIASMLRENQTQRPNIYQVLREACVMQGKEPPIQDIYGGASQARSSEAAPGAAPGAVVGAVFSPAAKETPVIPDIVPMRRGRPAAAPTIAQPAKPKPSPSPMRVTSGDPFAALDGKASSPHAADEIASRFPTLDQFSILHDSGNHFSFDDAVPAGAGLPPAVPQKPSDMATGAQRPTTTTTAATTTTPQAAAAAATASMAASGKSLRAANASPERRAPSTVSPRTVPEMSRASAIISGHPELQAISTQRHQASASAAVAVAPRPAMVSTGTMTSPPPTPPLPPTATRAPPYQVFKFPTQHDTHARASSLPRKQFQDAPSEYAPRTAVPAVVPTAVPAVVPTAVPAAVRPGHVRQPSSSRPSLESGRPGPETAESSAPALPTRPRPVSTYLDSNLDYLRDRENDASGRSLQPPTNKNNNKYGDDGPSSSREDLSAPATGADVDYLRSMEELESKRERPSFKQLVGGGGGGSGASADTGARRTSLHALAQSGTKNILAGRFGDAFKRFETTGRSGSTAAPAVPPKLAERQASDFAHYSSSDSLPYKADTERERPTASAVNALDDAEATEDMTPEQRREVERRRLSLEEKRVAQAGAEYRQRIDTTGSNTASAPLPLPKSIGGVSRAVSIQNRVQNLLSEAQSPTGVTRTASGYGRFTDDGVAGPNASSASTSAASSASSPAVASRKPIVGGSSAGRSMTPMSLDANANASGTQRMPPPAKPKPMHLNKPLPLPTSTPGRPGRPGSPTIAPPARPVHASASARSVPPASKQALVAMDLPGQPVLEDMSAQDRDDYIRDFTRRFPSLTAIEMVERDVPDERR